MSLKTVLSPFRPPNHPVDPFYVRLIYPRGVEEAWPYNSRDVALVHVTKLVIQHPYFELNEQHVTETHTDNAYTVFTVQLHG